MSMWKKFAGGVAFSAMAAALVQPAMAQETTSGIGGTVSLADGTAAANAKVVITDTRNGLTRTVTTGATGSFDVRNLNVGGPYSVSVSAPGQQPTRVDGVSISLGQATSLNLQFSGTAAADVVVVTAQQVNAAPVAIGPSSVFSLADLETQPAINRDIKDVVRADPRVYLDETAGGSAGTDGIQCGGASPRFNSLTVDGIGLNDGFGLNSNGYPTERMPFPFDAINQVSVELAPYDVQYGGFTACNINAVTKSGTNNFHGGFFFDYTNDSLRGDSIEGRQIFVPEFEEKRYGASFGGPIIQDKLFFFGAYEKFEGSNLFLRGPEGSGQPNIITGFTQAIYDQIVNGASTIYGISNLGGTPTVNPTSDEKYLARLDWNISDRHRAAVTYNYSKGLNLTESDSNQVTQFEFGNHLYDRGAELKAYSMQVFSDWTDNFSTEFRASRNEVDNTVKCRDGGNIGEVQIQFSGRTIFFGCDDSRHSNDLNYSVTSYKAKANYRAGDHLFSAGLEKQTYDVFNQFVQNTEGLFIFTSVQAFLDGTPSTIRYGNAASQNPADASASFSYDINTAYLQDEFELFPDVTATVGVRYDWYTNKDKPSLNSNFVARNGFANTENLDGKNLVQPRIGLEWDASDRLSVRGGFGLFSGGNPNVWVSNSYSNDGLRNIQLEARAPLATGFALAQNIRTTPNSADERGSGQTVNPTGALWGIPSYLYTAVGSGVANSTVNAIDPDFEPASEWKMSLGATYEANFGPLGDDYIIDVDFLRSASLKSSTVVDRALEQVGTNFDGTPLYKRIDRTDPDCLVASTLNTAACSTRSQNDLVLINAGDSYRNIYSASIRKEYDFGLEWTLGYAHVDAEDSRSMTSSVAFSNWTSNAVSDINNTKMSTSNYEIPNRITLQVSYEKEFFPEYATKVSMFGQAYQGRAYSYTFLNGGLNDVWGDSQESLHLLYVPTGPTDPNVFFCGGAAQASPLCRLSTTGAGATQYRTFDTASFFKWADEVGLERGRTVGRNDQEGSWNNKFDIKIEQEVPTFFGKGSLFGVIENVGNLINDEWGVPYEAPFPQQIRIVEADRDAATGKYVYRQVSAVQPQAAVASVAFWSVNLGLKWNF
ncbi:MAG: TonB-dependent receptor [Alphaproteobacteria bacterium]|nr:TonB-dependent receptor [Alphaproteobacteria bacterium]